MSTDSASPQQRLFTAVKFLKGVGPARAELLERLGLRTAADVLFYFPRDYESRREVQTLEQLEEGVLATVRGVVEEVDQRGSGVGRSMLGVLVRVGDDYLRGVWFNQPFIREKFSDGQTIAFTGRPRFRGGRWEMAHPRVEEAGDASERPDDELAPVYPLTEGLAQYQMRKIVRAAIDSYGPLLEETFPPEYRDAHDLMAIDDAVRQIHFPQDRDSAARARRRFVYQELLLLELALAVQRHVRRTRQQAPSLEATARIDARIRRRFSFDLTEDQNRAIREIAADMGREVPMHRLLQGEVGSGKTVVAVYGMLLAVAHNYQAVFMAPTEVLAQQHAATLERLLAASRVRTALLTGSLTAAERKQRLESIREGEVDFVIGTQAVLQESVEFARLGLVVIDEQHKFGVRQRATLKSAGKSPHYLVMTATPIPRTVTMTLFGDLDVSVLRACPPGRQAVHTYLATGEQRGQWWEFFRGKLDEGRQGYVVTPLVDASESVAAADLEATFEELANGELDGYRLGILHGRMPAGEKSAIMESFREGKLQALVATTVVEVGVDVPNATLLTIESGHRFGLSQLHQLRGRISRGSWPGYCCVFADEGGEMGRRRLEAFAEINDGFRLAEIDLELRGPGDLLGVRQHGVAPLRVADLVRDREILEEARRDARAIVDRDPGLRAAEFERLRRTLLSRYGQTLELGIVG